MTNDAAISLVVVGLVCLIVALSLGRGPRQSILPVVSAFPPMPPIITTSCVEEFLRARWRMAELASMPASWVHAAELINGAALYCSSMNQYNNANLLTQMAMLARLRAGMLAQEIAGEKCFYSMSS